MKIHRDAAAVVDHRNGVVVVDGDRNFSTIARQSLVHRIVNDFIHQVVQAHLTGRSDVHGGAEAHRFQTLEHFNTAGIVNVGYTSVHFVGHISLL